MCASGQCGNGLVSPVALSFLCGRCGVDEDKALARSDALSQSGEIAASVWLMASWGVRRGGESARDREPLETTTIFQGRWVSQWRADRSCAHPQGAGLQLRFALSWGVKW